MSDNEYTPTTEHVRAQYARQENYDEFYEGDLYDTPDGQVSAAEFDRWLAAHDREVAAQALTDFADRFRPGDGNPWALHVRARARRRAAALGVPEEAEHG